MSTFKVAVSVRDPEDLCTEALGFGVKANRVPGIARLIEAVGPYEELMEFLTDAVGMTDAEADVFIDVYGKEV